MAGKMPTHNVRARTGRKDDRDNDILMTVGVAWKHERGDGFNLQLNSVPVGFDGFLLIVERRERED
jgi:hypothetical protein